MKMPSASVEFVADTQYEKLRAHGFDGEQENLRCFVRIERGKGQVYREALQNLRRLRVGASGSMESIALEGKLLINLDSLEEARALLEPHRDKPCRLPLDIWLAECLILLGEPQAALPLLDAAVRHGPPIPWALFFRGAARLALGDSSGARRDAARLLKARPSAAAHTLLAMAHAAARRWDRAGTSLKKAAALSPRQTWPLELLHSVCMASGDALGAKKALERALFRSPNGALHAQLAKVQEKLGLMPQAIGSAATALSLAPSAALHGLKASLHHGWREYDLATKEYDLALRLDRGEPEWLFQRSRCHMAAGRLREALRDVEAAVAGGVASENVSLREIQLLVLNRRWARAERAVARLGGGPLADFCRGYAELALGRFGAASRRFGRSAERFGEGALRLKAGFYHTVASVMQRRPAERAPARLVLIGLGVNPPYSATAQALWEMSRCDILFNNVTGDEITELLCLLCRRYRPVAYHQEDDEARISRIILREIDAGNSVGFVTRGHALIQGPLALELKKRCVRQGISWRCLPSVSSADFLEARHGHLGPDLVGSAVCDTEGLMQEAVIEPALPLTIFWNYIKMNKPGYRLLCRALALRYGGGHCCLVLDHQIGQTPRRFQIGELPGAWDKIGQSALLHIPAMRRT